MAAGLTACGSAVGNAEYGNDATEEEKTVRENGRRWRTRENGEAVTLTMWVESKNETDSKQELDVNSWKKTLTLSLIRCERGRPGKRFLSGGCSATRRTVTVSFTLMDKYANAGILAPLNQYFDQWMEKDLTAGFIYQRAAHQPSA